MRDYLSLSNLGKAFLIGGAATALSLPRIVSARFPLETYIPLTFLATTLLAQFAVAWGHKAGLRGMFPAARPMFLGSAIAILLACVLTPIYLRTLDPIFRKALENASDPRLFVLRYPPSLAGKLALTLWSASFEVLFFQAAALAFFARLTGRLWATLLGAVLFRVLVAFLQVSNAGVGAVASPFILSSAAAGCVSCLIYAYAGMPAAMIFAAGQTLHLYLPAP